MEVTHTAQLALVRLGPGESVLDQLLEAYVQTDQQHSVIASAIGSLRSIGYALATMDPSGVPGRGERIGLEGALEIGSLQGHLGRDDAGQPAIHVHGTVFDATGRCIGGHIFDARVMITMEVALLGAPAMAWRRYHEAVEGSPPMPLFAPSGVP